MNDQVDIELNHSDIFPDIIQGCFIQMPPFQITFKSFSYFIQGKKTVFSGCFFKKIM